MFNVFKFKSTDLKANTLHHSHLNDVAKPQRLKMIGVSMKVCPWTLSIVFVITLIRKGVVFEKLFVLRTNFTLNEKWD